MMPAAMLRGLTIRLYARGQFWAAVLGRPRRAILILAT